MQKISTGGLLANQVALVTGGANGIGEATARLFASEGAAVVVADINCTRGQQLVANLVEQGLKATFVRTDVTQEDNIEAAVGVAASVYGRLDIMINNAGAVGAIGSLLTTDQSDWRATMAVLLDSVFFGTKHAARQMVKQKSGVILSLSSIAGVVGGQGPHAYSTAKHGVVGLTRSAASELAQYGIRVNAVAPHTTITPMVEQVRGGRDAAIAYGKDVSPLKTVQLPEEIAQTLLFLCSPGAAHITAQTIRVDSGVSLMHAVANEKYHSKANGFMGQKPELR